MKDVKRGLKGKVREKSRRKKWEGKGKLKGLYQVRAEVRKRLRLQKL